MTQTIMRRKQRGAALLMVLFSLILLTAIAMTMLFGSDTETNISVNYRDKQSATFAALAALQEARDRIHPISGDLSCPSANAQAGALCWIPQGLPATTTPNVLYIVNPGAGQTAASIAPWAATINGAPNPYYDSELCNENTALCSSGGTLPNTTCNGVNTWCRYYDNSGNAQATSGSTPAISEATWKITDSNGHAAPLDYKWVRITLKADNMACTSSNCTAGGVPVLPAGCQTASGGSCVTSGKQVCWTGSREVQLPTGYQTTCLPVGYGSNGRPVSSIAITNQGAGYTSTPTVTISGGGGSGATATASVTQLPVGVTSVNLTNSGKGYTSPPTITVVSSDGNGSGATVTATLDGKPVQSVTINNPTTPACYQSSAVINAVFSTTSGSGAAGTVTMTGNRCVYSFTASGSCTKNTTYTISASNGSGSGFSGTVAYGNNKNSPSSVTLNGPGNYSTVPTTFTASPSCANLTISPQYGVQISGVTVTAGGTYSSAPSVTFTGGTPANGSTVPTGTGNLQPGTIQGAVTTLTITNAGSGYTSNPTLVFSAPPSGGGNSTATGTASIATDYGVTGITLTNGGSGYTSTPTVTVGAPASGTQATATASLGSAGPTGSGTPYQPVYTLTSLAQTVSGSRKMTQMEVAAQPPGNFGLGGALTLIGPNPTFGTPHSNNFQMIGTDCPTCGTPPSNCDTSQTYPAKPAIGIVDPTGATNPSAVQTVINSLAKPQNYIGINSAPDVENANLNFTAQELDSLVAAACGVAQTNGTQYCASNAPTGCVGPAPNSVSLGTTTNPVIDCIQGDFTMGPSTGYGILVVTGQLSFHGNYGWNGLVLVIGSGASVMSGGGNGQIVGSVFVANTAGGTLNPVNVSWNGGGGNGIQYDHCWADNMLSLIPFSQPSPNAMKVLSQRMLEY